MIYNVLGNDGLGTPADGGKTMKVATYVRVSTIFEEQDSSIINQEEGLIDYIHTNNWLLFDTYSERKTSFSKRKEFMRLIKDAMGKKFDVILVKSLSRLGRSIGELNTIVPELVKKGIRFVAITESFDTTQSDWQTKLAIFSMLYQMSSQTTSDFVRMAERTRAMRGEFTGSFPPYGYEKADKKLVPATNDTPEIVRRIFSTYQEGTLGMQAIANQLNTEKVPTPAQVQGRKNGSEYWCQSSIEYILTNPAYIGYLVAQKEQAITLGSSQRKNTAPTEQIVIPDNHPALISKEQYQMAQSLIQRRSHNKVSGMPNLFTHLLFCADCGGGMHCVKRPYGKTHYMCGKYKLWGKDYCKRHSIHEANLLDLIQADIHQLMNEHVNKDTLVRGLQKGSQIEEKNHAKEVAAIKNNIDKIEKRKQISEDKWLDGDITKEQYHEMLDRLSKELTVAKEKLLHLTKSNEVKQPLLSDIAKLVSLDKLDRELLLMLVKRIDVKEDGDVKITYNFKVTL
ncbi:recombinase family protein [Paenibacillus donghaensis]|uniref:Recombinase family protein n=1 Tax=Paenibacillus donghaensis TaxID=414771 RepID=A0A2Z2KPG0_9BACL|nr:recombinase family protein [Paenibacillus donghaensis]ASA25620.1 hypothetical protein B9T62_35745 [Paenibacillus donghaensis]